MFNFNEIVLLACLAATLFMTGLIWFVQVVHYPLMSRVGAERFPSYHDDHSRRTGFVVFAPMVVELLSAAWLVHDSYPLDAPLLNWLGLFAALATWGLTACLAVPAHNRLSQGFDPIWHRRLVVTNWLRTAAWTAHSVILVAATSHLLPYVIVEDR